MFESAIFRNPNNLTPINAGQLAEALLFYQNVHLILDENSVPELERTVGVQNLCRLIDNGFLKVSYQENILVIQTEGLTHRFASIMHLSSPSRRKQGDLTREDKFKIAFERGGVDPADAARHAKALSRRIPHMATKMREDIELGILKMAISDASNPSYTRWCAEAVIRRVLPELEIPRHWNFALHRTEDDGFVVISNFDFVKLRELAHARAASTERLNADGVMIAILNACTELNYSARNTSELFTNDLNAGLIRQKLTTHLVKRETNANEIVDFQKMTVEGKLLAEAINTGRRSFAEFIDLLEKSAKFKVWLKNAHPDRGLAREYLDAVSKATWLDKIGGKTTRFFLATGLGAATDLALPTGIGTLTGLTVGAADSFLVDKLVRGWRPNQFVEERMFPFVSDDPE